MCTLSIVHTNDSTIITSNRDDAVHRSQVKLRKIKVGIYFIYYLEDPIKKGTWLAFNSIGKVAVLLNGCNEKHKIQAHHTESRGKIPIDFLKMNVSLSDFVKIYSFQNYEPFTLVVWQQKSINELKWNGEKCEILIISNIESHHLWSSVTLYNKLQRAEREQLFVQSIQSTNITSESVFNLLSTPSNNIDSGFYILRDKVRTLSTSQVVIEKNVISLKSLNHIEKNEFSINFYRDEKVF